MDENGNTNYVITNDILYSEIEAGIVRIKNSIIDQLLMSDDEMLLDDIIDEIQMTLINAEKQKKLYHSWIFKRVIPDEFIFDPGKDDRIENEENINMSED